jgi:ketosteroid isomerase-like protein
MKSLTTLIVAAVMLCTVQTANAQSTTQSNDALTREVEQRLQAMSQAAEKGDLKLAASYYADDAIIRQSKSVAARGREEIDRYFTGIASLKSWKLESFSVSGTRDLVYQTGRSTLVSGSPEHTSVVDFLVVWKRQADGTLRIHLDYYHSPPRPPGR